LGHRRGDPFAHSASSSSSRFEPFCRGSHHRRDRGICWMHGVHAEHRLCVFGGPGPGYGPRTEPGSFAVRQHSHHAPDSLAPDRTNGIAVSSCCVVGRSGGPQERSCAADRDSGAFPAVREMEFCWSTIPGPVANDVTVTPPVAGSVAVVVFRRGRRGHDANLLFTRS
jgi:hypothetical protein